MTHLRLLAMAAVAVVGLGVLACGDSPVDPGFPDLEMLVVGGDGQYGTPGQRLLSPLRILVRRVDTGAPQADVTVEWTVESGDASLVTTSVGTTDEDGVAEAVVQLGTTPGAVRVRAELRQVADVSVELEVYVASRPTLQALSTSSARGRDTLTLDGSDFSATPDQNVVLFSGIRGRVVEASQTSLRVEVPACLPAREVYVTTQLGALVSAALPLTVSGDVGDVVELEAGLPMDVQDDQGFACVRLPGGGSPYLLTVESTGTVGAAHYGYTLAGLTTSGAPVPLSFRAPLPLARRFRTLGVAEAFEARLRAAEASLLRERRQGAPGPAAGAAAQVPAVGETRSFQVWNGKGEFDAVTAVVRLVSDQAVFYVDQAAPAGGYTEEDLAQFAADFDEVIFPTDTAAFGAPSDLDGNQRVVILLTPKVNSLTDRGAAGFIGGFFYGLDLQPEKEGSNGAEVFYGMVPDISGQYSDPRSRDQALRAMPAILAHEFMHMIHFNERILKAQATGVEALWLSEGLAQMAEELVARAFLSRGASATAALYREGNVRRARYYLADPAAVTLIVGTGQGSLEERGAGWLFTLYLWDRDGGDEILRRITRTTKTGTENVASAVGGSWTDVFSDWAAALYLDGLGDRPYSFEYPTVQLRDLLRASSGYPLSPEAVGGEDFLRSGQLWSSSAQHYIVIPPTSGSVALRLGGEAGGDAPADAVLGFRIVRLY